MTSEQQPTTRATREVELLWGLREAGKRGPKPKLSREAIVDAAVAVADAEGLESVSMQRVAKELGYTTMSLYRHVDSKEDLLLLMNDTVSLAAPSPPPRTDGDWRAGLEQWCRGALALYREHPWATHIPLSGPPSGPNGLRWMEAGLREVTASGLQVDESLQILMLLMYTVRDACRLENDMQRIARERSLSLEESMGAWAESVRGVLDPEKFPTVSRVFEEGTFDQMASSPPGEANPVEELSFSIHRILDGIESYVRRQRAQETDEATS